MKMLKPALLAVAAILIFWIFYWAMFIPKETVTDKISQKLEEQKQRSDFQMKGVVFSEISNGIKYWEIKAITSQINRTTGVASLNDIKGYFYNRGKKSVDFIAPRVFWDMANKRIKIEAPVGYDRNYKFETAELNWALDTKTLSTETEIRLESGKLSITARGMNADAGLEKMVLRGGPKAVVRQSQGDLKIEAEEFELNGSSGSFSANGDASVSSAGMTMSCRKIVYDKDRNILRAYGNVTMVFKDISAVAGIAEYFVGSGTVIMSGSARAARGGSELQGEKLKIDLKNNKMSLEGRSRVVVDEEEPSVEGK